MGHLRGARLLSIDQLPMVLRGLHHQGFAVGQVAVVGLPDDALGERICAAIVVAPGHPRDAAPDRAALRQFLTDRGLATFKMPDQVAIVGSLPVTAVGKIDKRSLTTTLLAAQSS